MTPKLARCIRQGLHLLLKTNAISTTSADDIFAALDEADACKEEFITARILHETKRAVCLDILYKHVWLTKRMLIIHEQHDDVIVFTLRSAAIAEIKEIIP